MTRPVGIAPGAIALVAAWFATLMIAMLTGAAAVVILLAIGAVCGAVATVAGPLALRSARVTSVSTGAVACCGDELGWSVQASCRTPMRCEIRINGEAVATGVVVDGSNAIDGVAPARGVHVDVEVRCSSAGSPGLLWWRRRVVLPIEALYVAAPPAPSGAAVERVAEVAGDGRVAAPRDGRDQIDGVRPWRDGDEVNAVHWPSSLRSGELIVRQQVRDVDERWIVRARLHTGDADAEAARVLRSIDDGFTAGARVTVQAGDGEPAVVVSRSDAIRWCAQFEPSLLPPPPHWWKQPVGFVDAEPDSMLTQRARWLVAAATAIALVMLLQPLGYGIGEVSIVLVATAIAAVVSMQLSERLQFVRQLAGLVTAAAVGISLIDVSQITSVATSLRYFLPQALVALVVMQGFECRDRRAARVSLACAALLTAYSAGVRVDPSLGAWLLAALACCVVALLEISRPDRSVSSHTPADSGPRARRPFDGRAVAGRVIALAASAVAVLALLAIVPIPKGPTQLTLPSFLQERRPTGSDGALASPDGSPLLGGSSGGGGSSAAPGRSSAGSYTGFSPTMDTSSRGALSDQVVLRVRAPYPDFWRGQTFTTFDGRTWSVDAEEGVRTDGPDHSIVPANGDVSGTGDEFIQTFYAQVDLPNLVFAATSARRVLLDAPLWQRSDGALRAGVVLPAGSAYTVVSERSKPTADRLRADGEVARLGSPSQYLQLPETTTDRVRALARQLATGSTSTYDTVLAIEAWLHEHVGYDLDAPVPAEGVDAVDDFLFRSQRGFCEQIASAEAVLLRSLGVPARVATGYVPSDRDEVAGVWISRASDAHAWVEVRFPSAGWVAFDPTASVPLSGDADDATIGGDLVKALSAWLGNNVGRVLGVALAAGLLVATGRALLVARARRRRGRWGVLQDRFVAAAVRNGASTNAANADLAAVFDDADARALAAMLDACAFAASWTDSDEQFVEAADRVSVLESAGGRRSPLRQPASAPPSSGPSDGR